ncbi:hypothetical protein L6452_27932 [Arctium lappa]|uniref:Uncharacterized protein n=1 Tax=Arctium lappa TaxID=4217 RepID=A0ACB9A1D3_ARCLA|nr:hypothetical protein L6452_27932 [Arctium lappa]
MRTKIDGLIDCELIGGRSIYGWEFPSGRRVVEFYLNLSEAIQFTIENFLQGGEWLNGQAGRQCHTDTATVCCCKDKLNVTCIHHPFIPLSSLPIPMKITTLDETKPMCGSFVEMGRKKKNKWLFIFRECSHMYGLPLR